MPSSHLILCRSILLLPLISIKVKLLSRVRLFVNLWTVARQAPPSMGFSRQEYWNGLPFSSPGDLPNPGIKPTSPALQADALNSEPPILDTCFVSKIYATNVGQRKLNVYNWVTDISSIIDGLSVLFFKQLQPDF